MKFQNILIFNFLCVTNIICARSIQQITCGDNLFEIMQYISTTYSLKYFTPSHVHITRTPCVEFAYVEEKVCRLEENRSIVCNELKN